jgi:hypothetical protein
MDAAQHSLLELEPDLESALDLTCEEKSTGFSARFLKTRKYRATHTSPGSLSSFTTSTAAIRRMNLSAKSRCGRASTPLLFFGARALREYESAWTMIPDDPPIYMTEKIVVPDMRAKSDLQNLAVFPAPA